MVCWLCSSEPNAVSGPTRGSTHVHVSDGGSSIGKTASPKPAPASPAFKRRSKSLDVQATTAAESEPQVIREEIIGTSMSMSMTQVSQSHGQLGAQRQRGKSGTSAKAEFDVEALRSASSLIAVSRARSSVTGARPSYKSSNILTEHPSSVVLSPVGEGGSMGGARMRTSATALHNSGGSQHLLPGLTEALASADLLLRMQQRTRHNAHTLVSASDPSFPHGSSPFAVPQGQIMHASSGGGAGDGCDPSAGVTPLRSSPSYGGPSYTGPPGGSLTARGGGSITGSAHSFGGYDVGGGSGGGAGTGLRHSAASAPWHHQHSGGLASGGGSASGGIDAFALTALRESLPLTANRRRASVSLMVTRASKHGPLLGSGYSTGGALPSALSATSPRSPPGAVPAAVPSGGGPHVVQAAKPAPGVKVSGGEQGPDVLVADASGPPQEQGAGDGQGQPAPAALPHQPPETVTDSGVGGGTQPPGAGGPGGEGNDSAHADAALA